MFYVFERESPLPSFYSSHLRLFYRPNEIHWASSKLDMSEANGDISQVYSTYDLFAM